MSRNKAHKIVLVTGGSSGIGFETSKALALDGYTVYAAARRLDRMAPLAGYGVRTLPLDITSEESIAAAVDAIIAREGRIDILVNNAGFGYLGAIETVSMESARRQMEVNLFGMARLIQLVLPYMRENGGGRIVNVSSVAGKAVVAKGGWYNISKYAVEALSDSLRMETRPFGIDVVLIEPGGIRTDWGLIAADNLSESCAQTVYGRSAERQARIFRYAYTSRILSGPEVVSGAIRRAVGARHPRLRYRPGRGASLMVFFHAILPARWWDAINRALFG